MSSLLYKYLTRKQASLATDVGGAFLGSQVPYVGPLFSLGGTLHGFTTDDTNVPGDAKGLIPGVGDSRLLRRHRRVRKELVPESRFQRSRILADILAPIATVAAGNYAGRRIGEAANTMYPEEGGSIGAAYGTLLAAMPVVAGAIVAGFTPRRTHKEQQTAERAPFSRSLIPGVGTYDLFKRLGYSKTYDEAADRRRMEKDLAWLMEHRKKTR